MDSGSDTLPMMYIVSSSILMSVNLSGNVTTFLDDEVLLLGNHIETLSRGYDRSSVGPPVVPT